MIREEGSKAFVQGAMTLETAANLAGLGKAAIGRCVNVFDLTDVTEADSSGLAVVFDWVRVSSAQGKRIVLVNPPQNLLSLAAVYGVGDLLPLG
jgi:phospholipid transport system transporter-binding protein